MWNIISCRSREWLTSGISHHGSVGGAQQNWRGWGRHLVFFHTRPECRSEGRHQIADRFFFFFLFFVFFFFFFFFFFFWPRAGRQRRRSSLPPCPIEATPHVNEDSRGAQPGSMAITSACPRPLQVEPVDACRSHVVINNRSMSDAHIHRGDRAKRITESRKAQDARFNLLCCSFVLLWRFCVDELMRPLRMMKRTMYATEVPGGFRPKSNQKEPRIERGRNTD